MDAGHLATDWRIENLLSLPALIKQILFYFYQTPRQLTAPTHMAIGKFRQAVVTGVVLLPQNRELALLAA